jgi:DNA-binding transcriptional ArsR family regulator
MNAPTRARPVGETRPAMRSAIVAALSTPTMTGADFRVMLAVLELTAAHGKLTDRVVRSELADRAGVSARTVTRSLAKFSNMGVVIWRPARARGQLGELTLCRAPVEMPDRLDLTRDRWLSRVQPNARQDEHERETRDDPTRDIGAVPLPPLNHLLTSVGVLPHCQHGFVFDAKGFSTCNWGCTREQPETLWCGICGREETDCGGHTAVEALR